MNGLESKFDFCEFIDDNAGSHFACNAALYPDKESAIAVFLREVGGEVDQINRGAVQWGYSVDCNGDPYLGWTLLMDEDGSKPRQCPVWVFEEEHK